MVPDAAITVRIQLQEAQSRIICSMVIDELSLSIAALSFTA